MTSAGTHLPEGYRISFAGWRDLLAVYRLEQVIFPQDAYGYFDLLVLLLAPGMVNLKITATDGALVGFASSGRLFRLGRTWIMTIGVHPAHQGRGLGRELLAACESLLPDPEIYLTVRESNTRARRLYLLAGYEQVRVKPRYYPGGETGIEMCKRRSPVPEA
ncbi:MAG: hypothetical protein Kow0077_12300 [Anaerolineae bacterium]